MKSFIRFTAVIVGVIFFSAVGGLAGDLTIPNTFTSGEPAVAAEVNANFNETETAVDDNNLRIIANAADISTNAGNIAATAGALNGMPGIAYIETGGSAIYPAQTDREVLSLTINAPTDGYVMATYGGLLRFSHTEGVQSVGRIWMNLDAGEFGEGSAFRYLTIYPNQLTAYYYYSPSLFLVVPVSSGNTTFYVMTDGSQGDADGDILLYQNSLSLQFFPNNYEAP